VEESTLFGAIASVTVCRPQKKWRMIMISKEHKKQLADILRIYGTKNVVSAIRDIQVKY